MFHGHVSRTRSVPGCTTVPFSMITCLVLGTVPSLPHDSHVSLIVPGSYLAVPEGGDEGSPVERERGPAQGAGQQGAGLQGAHQAARHQPRR